MKILWLSHLIPYPPKGGVLQRSYNLLKELSRYHEVDLLAFNQRRLIGPLFSSIEIGVAEAHSKLDSLCRRHAFFSIPNERTAASLYLLSLRSLFSKPYTIGWLQSKEFAHTLAEWINDTNYDVVHFDTISLVPYYYVVPNNIATCLDHHNIESHMLLRRSENEKNLIKKFYYLQEGLRLARYERQYCPRFSLNITCSDVDSKRLKKLSPVSEVETIPNGADIDFFVPGTSSASKQSIIFVGTMNWYPNIEAVLYIAEKLWKPLKDKYPQLECTIVGANPPPFLIDLSKKLEGFIVTGFVDDVRPYLQNATVYVCPIRDGGGTKLKVLDAMAMSKPVVAHPIACEGIEVTDNVNVLLSSDETSFIKNICQLIDDKEKREALGREGRTLVEKKYNYRSIGRVLSENFERIAV